MAPEGLDEESSPTEKRDVWAFAMTVMACFFSVSLFVMTQTLTLQEVFTGRVPFDEILGSMHGMARIFRGKPDRPDCMRDEWWDLCIPCWENEPASRPTMKVLIHKIERVSTLIFRCDNFKLNKCHRL